MGSSLALVALSVGVLLASPALAVGLVRVPRLVPFLDSFVLVTVGGIVGFHVVPQSAAMAGPWAVGAAVLGLVLPVALHRLDGALTSAAGRRVRDSGLLVAFLVGSFVHALFDGAALSGAALEPQLALGVLLHRLPVGLALWLLVRPRLGPGRTALVVLVLSAGTTVGALGSGALLATSSVAGLAVLQAFVGGSILHIVAESAPFSPPGANVPAPHDLQGRAAGLLGTLAAVALLVMVDQLHAPHVTHVTHAAHAAHAAQRAHVTLDAGATFLALALHVAPAMLVSFLLVGVLTALYPAAPRLWGRGPRIMDASAGMAAGLSHPLCSCTVAPLYESLLRGGASPAAARAFLVAAPELGVPAVLVSLRLLGLPFTVARAAGAAALAVLAGLAARGRGRDMLRHPAGPLRERLVHGLRHGVVDAVDHVGPWLLLGLGAAALLEPALREGAEFAVPVGIQIVAVAVAALPLYLCAAGTTVIAALLVHKGLAAGAAVALLLVGPATSLPTLKLLERHHGRAAAALFAALVVGGATVAGAIVESPILEGLGLAADAGGLGGADLSLLHDLAAAVPGALEWLSLAAVASLMLLSLGRQGVRGFVLQIMSPQHTHVHDHAHGPGCDHDHGPAVLLDDGPSTLSPASWRPASPLMPRFRRAVAGRARVPLEFDPRAGARAPDAEANDHPRALRAHIEESKP